MSATTSGTSARNDLRVFITSDGLFTGPCRDCGEPVNRQLRPHNKRPGEWQLAGRPRYCEHCKTNRAKIQRRKAKAVYADGKRPCITCGLTFKAERQHGRRWAPRHCPDCTAASWACKHCDADTRTTSHSAQAAHRRGHVIWAKQWGKPSCDDCRDKDARRRKVVRLADYREPKLKDRVKATFYYHDTCQACGTSSPFVALGMNVGCTDECTAKITRDVHQHRRRMAFRNAENVELISPGRVYKRDRGICQLCGVPVPPPSAVPAKSKNAAQLDHIVPMSDPHFGDHTYDNIRLTHAACNVGRQASRRGASYRRQEPLKRKNAA